jgi:hypothetical protein
MLLEFIVYISPWPRERSNVSGFEEFREAGAEPYGKNQTRMAADVHSMA